MKKVRHKIVKKRDWPFTIFAAIVINLIGGLFIVVFSFLPYRLLETNTSLVASTILATCGVIYINYMFRGEYSRFVEEKVEHIIEKKR